MKINSMPAFKADFDTNRKSTIKFLKDAFYQAIENDRMEEFDDAIADIEKMPSGKINIIATSPQNDVFAYRDDRKQNSIEITIPNKNTKTKTLDALIGMKTILKQVI